MRPLDYSMNWKKYILYADAARKLIHRNGDITIGKLKSSFFLSEELNRLSFSICWDGCDQNNPQAFKLFIKRTAI